MNIKGKRDFKTFFIYLIIFLLLGLVDAIDIYVITIEANTFNYVLLILASISMFLLLIFLILTLLTSFYPIILKDDEIIVKSYFKKIHIKYTDIYALYSNSLDEKLTGDIYIYQNNAKVIKVKDLRFAYQVKELILAKTNNEDYLIAEEDGFIKFINRFIAFFTSIFLKIFAKPVPILNEYKDVVTKFKENRSKKVFILISKSCYKNNLSHSLEILFKEQNINYYIKDISLKNPHEDEIAALKEEYLKENCDSILGIGGGAILDASKALGIILTNKKELNNYKGVLKVKKNIPFLILAPTTSGSGSETTMYLVISNPHSKYSIASPKVKARYAFLNEDLISTLPLKTLEASSMDALTHALEGYLNYPNKKRINKKVLEATSLIFDNLNLLVKGEDTKEIRMNLLKGSYLAGAIFDEKLVGNIHALSHALSMKYNLDHAKTNAIIMPEVLKTYLYNKKALKKMSKLSYLLGFSIFKDDTLGNAKLLIEKIENLNKAFGYSKSINEIQPEDLKELATHAYKEARFLYPCPREYSLKEFFYMYIHLKNIK